MAKKLAKYEIEALAQTILTNIKAANKKSAKGDQGQILQEQADALYEEGQALIKEITPTLQKLHQVEKKLMKMKESLEKKHPNFDVDLHPNLSIDFYDSLMITWDRPTVRYNPEANAARREIEQDIVLENLKPSFDVDALVAKLVKKYS